MVSKFEEAVTEFDEVYHATCSGEGRTMTQLEIARWFWSKAIESRTITPIDKVFEEVCNNAGFTNPHRKDSALYWMNQAVVALNNLGYLSTSKVNHALVEAANEAKLLNEGFENFHTSGFVGMR